MTNPKLNSSIDVNFKHRINIIFHLDDGSCSTLSLYFPTLEQAGILTYLLRRCLAFRHYEIVHDIHSKSAGYTTVGTIYEINHTVEKFSELIDKRNSKSEYCVKVQNVKDNNDRDLPILSFYLMSNLDAFILNALLQQGIKHITNMSVKLFKNENFGEWKSLDSFQINQG